MTRASPLATASSRATLSRFRRGFHVPSFSCCTSECHTHEPDRTAPKSSLPPSLTLSHVKGVGSGAERSPIETAEYEDERDEDMALSWPSLTRAGCCNGLSRRSECEDPSAALAAQITTQSATPRCASARPPPPRLPAYDPPGPSRVRPAGNPKLAVSREKGACAGSSFLIKQGCHFHADAQEPGALLRSAA
jgi:hypothetical protein